MSERLREKFLALGSDFMQELEEQSEAWKEAPLRVYFLTSVAYAGLAHDAYQKYKIDQDYYDGLGSLFQRYNTASGIDCVFWGSLSLVAFYAGARKGYLEYSEKKEDRARYYRVQSYQATRMDLPSDKTYVVDRKEFYPDNLKI